jgi:hypothetical protein
MLRIFTFVKKSNGFGQHANHYTTEAVSWAGRNHSYLPRKMEPTLSSETSAYNNIQTPGNFPEDYTLY